MFLNKFLENQHWMMGHWLQFVASKMIRASNRGYSSAPFQLHCPHSHSLSFAEEALGPLNSDSQMARFPLLITRSNFLLLHLVLKLSVSRKGKVTISATYWYSTLRVTYVWVCSTLARTLRYHVSLLPFSIFNSKKLQLFGIGASATCFWTTFPLCTWYMHPLPTQRTKQSSGLNLNIENGSEQEVFVLPRVYY